MTILMTVQYDGTSYNGWQRQRNTSSTIQEILENSLEKRLGMFHPLISAGRTDAGVHALAMPCSFPCQKPRVPVENLPQALNSLLPPDIRVTGAKAVPDDFDPILCAISKTYCYQLDNSAVANVFERRYSWHIHKYLDTMSMRAAAAHFVGTHDFKAFCASGGSAKTSVRTIFALDVEQIGDMVVLSVTGSGFLYNMVRIITGTLVDVGLGKSLPSDILPIILSLDRKKAGQTAPASGLTLVRVVYGD